MGINVDFTTQNNIYVEVFSSLSLQNFGLKIKN